MSQATKALPAGWAQVLDDVQARLDHAVARANARIDELSKTSAAAPCRDRALDTVDWGERLQKLRTFLESAEQVVQSVDEILHKEVTRLREKQATCETLRQRLAEGTGRAIG